MGRASGRLMVASLVLAFLIGLVPHLVSDAVAAEKVLKIGTVAPLNLKEGVEIKRWMELFCKVTNEKGGWKVGNDTYKLQSIVYDGGMNDAAKDRAAAERLVFQDGVKFMVASWGEVPDQIATITEPNKVLWLGCDFTDTTVKPDLKYFVRASGVYFARGLSYAIQKDAVARGAKAELSVNADSEFGRIGNFLWGEAAKFAGMKVLPGLTYPPDTADFGPVATKIVGLNPRPRRALLRHRQRHHKHHCSPEGRWLQGDHLRHEHEPPHPPELHREGRQRVSRRHRVQQLRPQGCP